MATFKFIEPSNAAITKLQDALNQADALGQDAQEKIEAAVQSIYLMLREPDSGQLRLHIKKLCELIAYHSSDMSDLVNVIAEQHGANYIDEHSIAEKSHFYAVVRG